MAMPRGVPIKTIITHAQPHLDELVAIFLLRKFGRSAFPGVHSAPVEFWRTGGATPDGRTAAEYEADGILLIGVGRGRFDEHPSPDRKRIQGQSATSLVAKVLRVDRRPELRTLLAYTTANDLKGAKSPYELAELVRKLNRRHPENPRRVLDWTLVALDSEYDQQRRFHQVARRIFQDNACIEEIDGPTGPIKVAYLNNDEDQVKAFAFSNHGGHTAILIQRDKNGRIQVFSNKYYKLSLAKTAEAIRLEELATAGHKPNPDTDYQAEGTVSDVPQWFYFDTGEMLLNGSTTAPDVVATQLSLETVTRLVISTITAAPVQTTQD